MNIENNRKSSSKVGKSDDMKILKNPKGHKNTKPKNEDKLDKNMSALRDLSYKVSKNEKGLSHDRPNYQMKNPLGYMICLTTLFEWMKTSEQ